MTTMTCDEANTFIEAIAVGDAVPDPIRAHVADCRTCARRLALAQRIEASLSSRPFPAVSAGFTNAVIARIRDERWRSEQVVDFGFNVAVALGVLLIVAGIGGFAWQSGVLSIGSDMAALLFSATRVAAAYALADARVVVITVLMASMAIGLWWWAEEDAVW
jgi:hypothetical protein